MAPPSLTFDVQDLDTPIALRRPGWDGFAAWLDSFLAGQTGDAQHNLVTSCALSPNAAERDWQRSRHPESGMLPSSRRPPASNT